MRNFGKNSGITLIALVVTIIVLLILAGISISILTGQNGILNKASEAKEKTQVSQEKESVELAVMDATIGDDGYQELTYTILQATISKQFGNSATVKDNEDGTYTVMVNSRVYDVSADGKIEEGVNWELAMANAKAPSSQNEERNNGVIGIGTDGNPVDMDLWYWAYDENTNGYALNTKEELETTKYITGYLGDFENGKIQGTIPAYIKNNENDWIAVTNLKCLFNNCIGLLYAPKIPKTVVNMFATFAGNSDLQYAPTIPKGVTNMQYCFVRCINLKEAPSLPEGLVNLKEAFCYTGILKTPNLPTTLVNMEQAFSYSKIEYSENIPDNVITLQNAFLDCRELKKAPKIGKKVENMNGTFNACQKLTGDIEIYSEIVSIADAIVWNTNNQINIKVFKGTQTENVINQAIQNQAYYSHVSLSYLPIGTEKSDNI